MRRIAMAFALGLALALAGCGGSGSTTQADENESQPSSPAVEISEPSQQPEEHETAQDVNEEAAEMRLSINGTHVSVEWEDNQAVADLAALASEEPLTINLSMYGAFEQVGPIGASLTTNDEQITTAPGDIVLYAGDQISIFYNPNSWSYTRLGHITDKTADELADLLGNGDVSITISVR